MRKEGYTRSTSLMGIDMDDGHRGHGSSFVLNMDMFCRLCGNNLGHPGCQNIHRLQIVDRQVVASYPCDKIEYKGLKRRAKEKLLCCKMGRPGPGVS